jgi:quinol monooxygenase YgiN
VNVFYLRFTVSAEDRAAFDEWLIPLVQECRRAPGCHTYEYCVNPEHPDGGIIFASFDSEEAYEAVRLGPAHIDMLAFGEERGMRDKIVDHFVDDEHRRVERPVYTGELADRVRERQLAADRPIG